MSDPNVIGVCAGCGEARKAEWQKQNPDLYIGVGMYIKMAFRDADAHPDVPVEHMWVRITVVHDQQRFEGVLDNDPVLVTLLKCGDTVQLVRSDIEEHLAQG